MQEAVHTFYLEGVNPAIVFYAATTPHTEVKCAFIRDSVVCLLISISLIMLYNCDCGNFRVLQKKHSLESDTMCQ